MAESSITDVSLFKFSRWHSGFFYFTGKKNSELLFIKLCCGKWNTVPQEAYLGRYEDFCEHPPVVSSRCGRFNWIATKFIPAVPLDRIPPGTDVSALIRQMAVVLDKLASSGIVHRDLRPENICIAGDGRLIVIDFGWAIYKELGWKKTPYDFIEKILNQEYRNAEGQFDDALSAYLSFKAVFPSLSEADLRPISDRIGRLVV